MRGGRIRGRVGSAASLTEMGVATRGAQLGGKLMMTGGYISQNPSYLNSHGQGVFPQLKHGVQMRPEDHGRLGRTCSRAVCWHAPEGRRHGLSSRRVCTRMSRSLRRTFQSKKPSNYTRLTPLCTAYRWHLTQRKTSTPPPPLLEAQLIDPQLVYNPEVCVGAHFF